MTPRHVHSTIRHLSAVVSRGEAQIRALNLRCVERYHYRPNRTDEQVAADRKKIKRIEEAIIPVRKALAALAAAVGEGAV